MTVENRINLFSPTLWKKHYSLYPVVGICALGCAMASAYIGYMMAYKTDLSLRPSRWEDNAPYKYVEPTHTTRLYGYSKPIEVDPEVVKLRKEIGSYLSK